MCGTMLPEIPSMDKEEEENGYLLRYEGQEGVLELMASQ
jgi:hypothetical protein